MIHFYELEEMVEQMKKRPLSKNENCRAIIEAALQYFLRTSKDHIN